MPRTHANPLLHSCIAALLAMVLLAALPASAQQPPRLDVAVSFVAERSLKSNSGQNFWMEGGSIELGANVYKGFGIAANIAGTNGSSIGTSGIPLSLVTATFGPRYRWHAGHKLSLYGEGLVGEANAFNTLVPAKPVAQTDANSLATQVGGGIDYRLSTHLAIRAIEAAWVRTQIPNATDNVQNSIQLGAGIVWKWAR